MLGRGEKGQRGSTVESKAGESVQPSCAREEGALIPLHGRFVRTFEVMPLVARAGQLVVDEGPGQTTSFGGS